MTAAAAGPSTPSPLASAATMMDNAEPFTVEYVHARMHVAVANTNRPSFIPILYEFWKGENRLPEAYKTFKDLLNEWIGRLDDPEMWNYDKIIKKLIMLDVTNRIEQPAKQVGVIDNKVHISQNVALVLNTMSDQPRKMFLVFAAAVVMMSSPLPGTKSPPPNVVKVARQIVENMSRTATLEEVKAELKEKFFKMVSVDRLEYWDNLDATIVEDPRQPAKPKRKLKLDSFVDKVAKRARLVAAGVVDPEKARMAAKVEYLSGLAALALVRCGVDVGDVLKDTSMAAERVVQQWAVCDTDDNAWEFISGLCRQIAGEENIEKEASGSSDDMPQV
jgi:hypothetical protein